MGDAGPGPSSSADHLRLNEEAGPGPQSQLQAEKERANKARVWEINHSYQMGPIFHHANMGEIVH